jgi:ABC-type glycerol-3-phosphate transport system substrate-binding protein
VILIASLICAMALPAFAADKESANITVFRPAVNPRDKNDVMVKAKKIYEKETGGKVTFVISDWANWQNKVLTYMAAGEPIDVVFARDADFPKFYTKGYLQPVDKYVDLKVPYLNKTGMDKAFKYENHYYLASHTTSNHYWIVMYNKSLMDEEGIPVSQQPLALYKAGKWDWNHLRDLAQKLTKDTSGSGKIDRWGFANWWTRGFVYMNGSSFTTVDKKGNLKLNFDDQRLTEALDFLEKAKKEGWYLQDNNIAQTGIQRRTVAMYMEREYAPSNIINKTKDEICYVPLPFGPSNKEKANIFETDGYGIGNGSKNPTFAGKFINIALKCWYEDDLSKRASTWPKEIPAMDKDMNKKAIYPGTTASALDSMLDNFLGEIVWTGNSASTAIAGYKAKAEQLVADANKPMEKPVQLPFKAVKYDFEEGDASIWQITSKDFKSVKVSIVDDSRAIEGKSLLISMDSATDGEWVNAVFSNADKLGVVGWRNYKISFDVKALNDPADPESSVFCKVYRSDLDNYGFLSGNAAKANEVFSVSGSVSDITENGKFSLLFGGHLMKDFVIDNIEITEKR